MTASLEINAPQITGSPVIGKHLVTRSSDGLFYVDGSIKGVPVKFAIDTGASVVVLNATDAERVGLKTERTPTHHIRTASGYSEMSWSEANDFVIAGKNIGKIDIAVMNNGPSVSLLGLNALSRLETVTIRKDQLIIE